jgi:thiol-disulfide isomerase/thioredoxin
MIFMRTFPFAVLLTALLTPTWAPAAEWRAPEAVNLPRPFLCAAQLPRNLIYDVCEDQIAAFAIALDKAKTQGRLLVVEFGATWCPQCAQIHRVLPTPSVLQSQTPELDYSNTFSLVSIGVSTIEKGKQVRVESGERVLQAVLDAAPKAEMRGWPFLAVIDPAKSGKVYTRNTADLFVLENGAPTLDRSRLRDVLKEAHDSLRLGIDPAPEPRRGLLARIYRAVVGEETRR